MRLNMNVLVGALLYSSGLVALARWWRERFGERHVIVLNYHRASEGNLRSHLEYLKRNYRLLHLEQAMEELFTPCQAQNKKIDRRTPLVVTFDDGYHDNYTHAFPLAQELQIPITIFLIPAYVESGDYFWWRESKRMVKRAQVAEVVLGGQCFHLDRPLEKALLAREIDSGLRYASSIREREAFLAEMRELLAVPPTITVEEEATLPLTWAEVHKMEESGWVSFGGHTMHHPLMSYLGNSEEVRREISDCYETLERELGHRIRTFAYPIGKPADYGEMSPQFVREAGYEWAFTTVQGLTTPRDDPYQLHRISGDVSRHWLVMAAEVSGIWKLFSPLWQNTIFNYEATTRAAKGARASSLQLR